MASPTRAPERKIAEPFRAKPVSATLMASGTMPSAPPATGPSAPIISTVKPANTFSMVWPAIMLANNRIDRLTGRVK